MNVTIGTRFTSRDSRPYTENGERGTHTTTVLAEVTKIDKVGFDWRVVEVLAESGRPSFAGTPTGGSTAWFGFEAALGRGEIITLLPGESPMMCTECREGIFFQRRADEAVYVCSACGHTVHGEDGFGLGEGQALLGSSNGLIVTTNV